MHPCGPIGLPTAPSLRVAGVAQRGRKRSLGHRRPRRPPQTPSTPVTRWVPLRVGDTGCSRTSAGVWRRAAAGRAREPRADWSRLRAPGRRARSCSWQAGCGAAAPGSAAGIAAAAGAGGSPGSSPALAPPSSREAPIAPPCYLFPCSPRLHPALGNFGLRGPPPEPPPLLCDEGPGFRSDGAFAAAAARSRGHGAAEPSGPAAPLLDRHPLQQYVCARAGEVGRERVPEPRVEPRRPPGFALLGLAGAGWGLPAQPPRCLAGGGGSGLAPRDQSLMRPQSGLPAGAGVRTDRRSQESCVTPLPPVV